MVKQPSYSAIQTALESLDCKLFNLDSRILTKVLAYFQIVMFAALLTMMGYKVVESAKITVTGLEIIEHNGTQFMSNRELASSWFFDRTTTVNQVPWILTVVWITISIAAFSFFIQLWAAIRLLQSTNEVLPTLEKMQLIKFWYYVNAVYTVLELTVLVITKDFQFGFVAMILRAIGLILVANYATLLTKNCLNKNSRYIDILNIATQSNKV